MVELPDNSYIRGYNVKVSDQLLKGDQLQQFRHQVRQSLLIAERREKQKQENLKKQQSASYTAIRAQVSLGRRKSFKGIALANRPGPISDNDIIIFDNGSVAKERLTPLNPWRLRGF